MPRRHVPALAVLWVLTGSAAAQQAPEPASTRFVEGNRLYAAGRYAEAAAAYQDALAANPALGEAHFFLASALDNQYQPGRRGQPANDRLLDAAREHYHAATVLLVRPDQALVLKRSLQFLAALYGRDKLNRPDEADPVVRRLIDLDPTDAGSYFGLARLHEDAGRLEEAERVLEQAQAALPDRTEVWAQTAQFHNRLGRFDDAMAAFEQVARIEPADPRHPYQMAVFYEEKVRKDFSLDAARRTRYLTAAMDAVDRALALQPDYFEATVYKSLIVRQQARVAADPVAQRQLLEEADRLQRLSIEIRERQAVGRRRP
jgi:tetratricopeptide (TPR) repeat protein